MEPAQKKILLVEDEAIIAMTEKRQLEQYGYAVKTAITGEDAIEIIRTSSNIDLVLMDINLGKGIDGTEAAEIILRDRDIPIVFVSSHTEPEIVEKTEKITSYGYVVKSSSITVLDASIKMAFKLFYSERKSELLNDELLKTNSILNMTFEQSPIPMILVSMPDERFKFLNTSAQEIFGISDEKSLIGTRLSEFKASYKYLDSNGNPILIENLALARVLRGESVKNEERIIVSKDGKKRNVLVSGIPIHNKSEIIGGYIALTDISERIAMEATSQASKEKAEILLNVAAEIIISLDCQGNITLLNDSGHKTLGYQSPELVGKNWFDTCLRDNDRDEGRKYFHFLLEGRSGSLITHESDVVTKNGEQKTILWHNSVIKDKDGTSTGMFSSGEDITERKEHEKKLLDSESKFSQIFHKSPYPILMIDIQNGKFSDVNEAMARSVEYSREELIGKSAVELGIITLESEQLTRRLIVEAGQYSDLEVMIQTRSGKQRLGLATGWIIEINGNPFFIQTIVEITERKQAEVALKQSQERLQFALEVSGLGEWELDIKTGKIHRNARWAEMLGYDPSEIADSFSQGVELQHPDDREAVRKAVKDYHEGLTEKFKVTYRMRTKNGKYKWIQDCGKIIEFDETGKPVRLCGTQADIDDQKKFEIALQTKNEEYEVINEELRSTTEELLAQNEEVLKSHELLRQSESRLLQAESAARIGHWALQMDSQRMIASKGADAIYGIDMQRASIAEVQQIPLPEYRLMLDKALSDLVTSNIPYDLEFKIERQNDGAILHIHSVATFDKKANTVFGVIQDITAQRKAEEALEKSVESLSFVLDASSLGYSDNDFETGKISRNEQWAEMLGYTLAEINENNIKIRDLIHPDDYEEIERMTQAHLKGKTDYYRMKYRLRTKQGPYKWILDCGKVVARSSDGKPIRACGTHQDITEEKRYENMIEKLLDEKELLLREVHHRIKNNMNTISSLLSLQAGSVKDISAADTLEDARNRIQSLTLLYDKLYQSSDYSELSIKNYINTLVDEVVGNFPHSDKVRIKKDISDFVLDVNRLQPLGILVNELLTNIMKYAFSGREAGLITVLAKNVDGHVTISVQDDGIGIPESVSFEHSTGFGLQLVHALAQQLQGTICLERTAGTKVVLEFVL